MKYTVLKNVRVGIALVFLLLISLFFLDFRLEVPEELINTTLYLQFAPSLMKFLTTLSLASAGFFIVMILTALFGRVYCSAICPLGILQDVFIRLSNLFKKKKKRWNRFSRPYNILRYAILGLTALVLIFGSTLLLTLLDPYSNFGRIFTYLFKPVVVGINNAAAGLLNNLNLYFLYRIDLYPVSAGLLAIPGVTLVVVFAMSVTRGRLFCNTVCPVGALLGIMSRYSLFRIRIEPSECTRCSLCEKACKAECIDYKAGFIDYSRCVACFNCINSCREGAVKFDLVRPVKTPVAAEAKPAMAVDGSKRKFITGSMAWLLGMAGAGLAQDIPRPTKKSTVPEPRNHPVCPPGSSGFTVFNKTCTACSLCVSVCPTGVLQPSFLEYGLAGLLQPRMDYHAGFCNFECTRCTEICPNGALLPLKLEEKKLTQLGIAHFIKENCIVHTEKTDCGACSEHCPTKAVHMVPYEGTLVIPEVNDTICIGCGACEYACPTVPYKAIFVDGNPLHLKADPPAEEEKAKIELEDDFPF
ncbi:MAG TPA: 4Fe-4S binding protein [Bacteroidetes bacterium]|nr:4Fe-4S binding protein [Bacteroidota bacterium]